MAALTLASLGPAARKQVEATLGKVKQKRGNPEQTLQIAVVKDILTPLEAAGRLTYFAVPNGFKKTAAEAGISKAMGARAGIGDLAIISIPTAGPFLRGKLFFIELKIGKGNQSLGQIETEKRLQGFGIPTYVCRSFDDVWAALAAEGLGLRMQRKPA